MNFASKLCSSVFKTGIRLCTNSTNQIAARSAHFMMKPIAMTYDHTTSGYLQNFLTAIPKLGILQKLLIPFSPILMQTCGFKVKGRLRRRCKDCYFVVRDRRYYVICPTHPRHKQMSMKKRDYKSWILTHATQSKIRPY